MASKLNKINRDFWKQAFLAAQLPVLLKLSPKRSPGTGVAHLAAEYADAAVTEFSRRFK